MKFCTKKSKFHETKSNEYFTLTTLFLITRINQSFAAHLQFVLSKQIKTDVNFLQKKKKLRHVTKNVVCSFGIQLFGFLVLIWFLFFNQ